MVAGEESLITTAARRGEPTLRAAEAQPVRQRTDNAKTSNKLHELNGLDRSNVLDASDEKRGFRIMKELTSASWIKAKGLLFLVIGVMAALLIIIEHTELKTAVLLAISIWCFCRFYYFAFYVIQHYVDDKYRFSGLGSFVLYLWRSKNDLNAAVQRSPDAQKRQNH
jgi:hypothetical protein